MRSKPEEALRGPLLSGTVANAAPTKRLKGWEQVDNPSCFARRLVGCLMCLEHVDDSSSRT